MTQTQEMGVGGQDQHSKTQVIHAINRGVQYYYTRTYFNESDVKEISQKIANAISSAARNTNRISLNDVYRELLHTTQGTAWANREDIIPARLIRRQLKLMGFISLFADGGINRPRYLKPETVIDCDGLQEEINQMRAVVQNQNPIIEA